MSIGTKCTPETETAASPAHHSQQGISAKPKSPFFRSKLFQDLTSPNLVNAANALLYAFITITCFLGPFMTNLIGFRYTLPLGSIGYPLYAAGLYLNNRTGATWLVYLGSVTCGISAGFFWSVEGAIATGYPEDRKRGRYITTWFTFRNFGNIIGGAISLDINVKLNEQGQVGYQKYLGFIAIQCLDPLFGLMLSNPEKANPIPLLSPLFWYFSWIQEAYPRTYLATYFTVRSRVLGSFLSAIVGTFATWLGGSLVDIHWTSNRKLRAVTTWTLFAALTSITWIWAVIIQNEYRTTNPILDWGDQETFPRGFALYLFERASLGMVENYIYWFIGNLSSSPGEQIRYSSLLRGIETAAVVAVGFGVQAVPVDLIVTVGINFALWFLAMPCSFLGDGVSL
ncbi:hypothetical protein BDV19DRAFT_380428 [Aspergillus venezuelensis]